MRTLLASAMWPRSRDEPVADVGHRGGAEPGGGGARVGTAVRGGGGPRRRRGGERKPRESTAYPAADQPSQPVTATTSPGRAPARVTGSWLRRSPRAVMETVMVFTADHIAADDGRPRHLALVPQPVHQLGGPGDREVGGDHQGPRSSAVGTAPMAAMSARFWAAALRPTSYAVDQSRRKCRPSSRMSVLATTLRSGAATTAASSPGPSRTAGSGGEPGRQLSDEAELPQLAHGSLHRVSPLIYRPGHPSGPPVASRHCCRYCQESCRHRQGIRQLPHSARHAVDVIRPVGLPVTLRDAITWRPFPPHDPRGRPGGSVVQAYILIQTEVGKASIVAETISKIPGVIQAEDVTGPYDVIVRAPVRHGRRARPHGGRQGAAGGRHHAHPDLSGRPPLTPVRCRAGRAVLARGSPPRHRDPPRADGAIVLPRGAPLSTSAAPPCPRRAPLHAGRPGRPPPSRPSGSLSAVRSSGSTRPGSAGRPAPGS